MRNYTKLLYCMLVSLMFGCSSNNSQDTEKQTAIDGMWRLAYQIHGGDIVDYLWSFDGGDFTQTMETTSRVSKPRQGAGIYTIGAPVTMPSGVLANYLDVTYLDQDNSVPILTKLDVVYIDNQTLYFGERLVNESCEGEHYVDRSVGTPFELIVINDAVRNVNDPERCFSRPTSLDFNKPHHLDQL